MKDLDVPMKDGAPQVDGILYDLGVSSPQFDEGERGFSYNHDAPLDMRMDQDAMLTAKEIVNEWPEEEIARILYRYGEEKFSRRIARVIVGKRAQSTIETTGELVELIKEGIPAAARRTGGHPANAASRHYALPSTMSWVPLKKACIRLFVVWHQEDVYLLLPSTPLRIGYVNRFSAVIWKNVHVHPIFRCVYAAARGPCV